MPKRKKIYLTALIFGWAILFCASATTANAQFKRIPIVSAAKNSKPTRITTGGGRANVQKVFVPVKEIRTETRTVPTSNLSVTTEPGAEVLLESLIKGAKPIRSVADKNGAAVFENLKAGNYKVKASLEGFDTQEQDLVKILPQKTLGMNLDLKPITYKLRIETNLAAGEVRYASAVYKGVDAKGSIISEEKGNYCIVKIEKNGEALIPDLRKGYYNIDIRPEALEYEPTLVGINVPEETEQDETASSEIKTFQIDLEKKISAVTFGAAWASGEWDLPSGWKLDKGMKTNGLPGAAMPRSDDYRYYTSFEMVSDVKSLDGGAVGFVVRAADAQNHYLIQISGANAAESYLATGYVVKNGEAKQIFSNPIKIFSKAIAPQKWFRVTIRGEKNAFKIFIDDPETGKPLPVGDMIDQYDNFRKGAVGIAARNGSKFEVGGFTVCASRCP